MQDVPQLYIISVDGKAYLANSWWLDPFFGLLHSTALYYTDICNVEVELSSLVPTAVWKYPLEDTVPEFLCLNGKIRMKGRI